MENILFAYLGCMTAFTFLLYAIDKRRAVRGAWRIPEATLLGCSMLGGAVGGLLGMLIARHKIRRWYFRATNICFSAAYIGLVVWVVLV